MPTPKGTKQPAPKNPTPDVLRPVYGRFVPLIVASAQSSALSIKAPESGGEGEDPEFVETRVRMLPRTCHSP